MGAHSSQLAARKASGSGSVTILDVRRALLSCRNVAQRLLAAMRRVLHLKMVTQCAMLEDFGIFLVLADKVKSRLPVVRTIDDLIRFFISLSLLIISKHSYPRLRTAHSHSRLRRSSTARKTCISLVSEASKGELL